MLSYTSLHVSGWSRSCRRATRLEMIVALDATPLSVPTGGIRRYTEVLANTLAEEFPDDELHLISDQVIPEPAFTAPLHRRLRSKVYTSRRWWALGLPRALSQLNAAIFHGTDFAVPYLPTRPSVMTLHDLSPWLDISKASHGSSASRRVRQRTPLLLRSGVATMVIAPSETVRRAAINHFKLNPSRVVAIPLAAAAHFKPVVSAPPAKPYFLFVGTLEPRKNLARLIEAWREIRKTQDVDLVLAGRPSSHFPAPSPEPGLQLLGAVSDDALPALYSNAAAFVYPSLYEGFGLPVLEAMQCGALVITSRDAAISEVTGGCAALQVNGEDTRELFEAMTVALRNPPEWRESALLRARQFDWKITAHRTREVYEQAIRVFSQS